MEMYKQRLGESRKTMIKKVLFVSSLCMILACSGCKSSSNAEKEVSGIAEAHEEETEVENNTETFEDVKQFFDAITEDMLNSCDVNPSSESYWNDSLVLLNQFNEDVRLYGIRAGEETAMLLYTQGEKVLIEYSFPSFRNFYEERPKLNVCDIDHDGVDEVIISLRTSTGQLRRYAMWVCDYEDKWNICMYDDYLQDIEDTIQYKYDDKNNTITFWDDDDHVLWEEELPEWANAHTYTGINFENNMGFDAETIQMEVIPQIELENSLPYEPVRITFNIGFADGNFGIDGIEVEKVSEGADLKAETYINEYVVLSDDTEIEGYEWMQYDENQVLRVKIQYKDKPADAYQHKEDDFLFITQDEEVSQTLVVNYEDKGIHIRLNEGTECADNHCLGEGCGFDAHFEDVTFDGKKDLIISVGNSRHAAYYCAYICENDGFRYEKTFEHISSYKIKNDEKVICGSDTDGMGLFVDTKYEYKNGEFVLVEYAEEKLD